jgi:hypothetical protein
MCPYIPLLCESLHVVMKLDYREGELSNSLLDLVKVDGYVIQP